MSLEREFLELIQKCRDKGGEAIVLHVFSYNNEEIGKLVILEDSFVSVGAVDSGLSNLLLKEVRRRSSDLFNKGFGEFSLDYHGARLSIVLEYVEAVPRLFVFGAGHVGQSVALVGALLGYSVAVIDDRVEFLTRERFPNFDIELLAGKYERVISETNIPRNSAVVIVTRGHQFDEICLQQVLLLEPRYVGMIGSRRRVLSIFKRLAASGTSKRLLENVHAPIGLDIGAVSPQEIAIAIMAEIIAVMRGCSVDRKNERRLL